MKKVGLYFGTFNPIHIGHLIIANHIAEYSDLDEIWVVVTPHNPFKKKKSLLENHHRYEMVYRATEAYPKLKPSDIEYNLPQPNYTVNTLAYLREKHPDYEFNLIMGEDNLMNFHKWKNHQIILDNHHIYVYPRVISDNIGSQFENHPKINLINAPIIEISSTFIRKAVAENKNIKPLLPAVVWDYMDQMNFYR